jgi:outer membrane protein assembly factor BamB
MGDTAGIASGHRARGGRRLLAAGVLLFGPGPAAWAQLDESTPVYISNASFAEEALDTVGDMLARGGADEAVRLIQRVIDEQGDRLIATDEEGVFISVRERTQRRVLGDAALLAAYRERQGPRAGALLAEGAWEQVARSYWLTAAGFEAGLRSAQALIESGSFGAGLRALNDLLTHPGAASATPAVREAAALASRAASYGVASAWASLDETDAGANDGSWAVAGAWAARAGLPTPDRVRSDRPAPARADTRSDALNWSGHAPGPVTLDGVVPGALHTGELTESDPADIATEAARVRPDGPQRIELGWALPTLAGGDLFTNDGLTLTCFDRFTLRVKWRVRAPGAVEEGMNWQTRSRMGRTVEDSGTVSVRGDLVYASLGEARSGSDDSVGRVVCVDRATGRVVWSVLLGGLDEDLRGAEPRGSIVIDGDTVVVGARKNLRSRRLVSLSLVGLDAETGALRWSRALGSAGSLPFQQLTQLSEGGVLRDGVVYWTDKMGLIAAVETRTGRVLWVRQTESPGLYTRGARTPYATSVPVINEHGLFVLTPDQSRILRLDPASGAVLSSRAAEPAGEASYLIGLRGRIAAVGPQRVAVYNASGFDTEAAMVVDVPDERGLRGRAVAAGSRLALPVSAGVAMLDTRAGVVTETIGLDSTGNIVLGEGQIVVADETRVRSFLSWGTASEMLARRIAGGDFEAALALADLAQRSGHPERVLGAVDDAVRLVAGRPSGDADRARVFEAVRTLADPDAGAPTGRSPVGVAARGELLGRLGSVARTAEQRVAHAMATGSWQDALGEAPGAAAAYQEILLQPAWAREIWRGGGLSVRAELEASRRLQALADRFGSRAMAVPDRMAEAEARGLLTPGSNAGASDWEALARRYPASRAAPDAWARAATAWLADERWAAGERAARTGLRAAARAIGRNQTVADQTMGELAGVLASVLVAQNRPEEARAALARARAEFGGITPTAGGLAVTLTGESAARTLATIGPRLRRDDRPALLAGTPVASAVPGDPGLVLMFAGQIGRIAAYRSQGLARSGADAIEPVWADDTVGSVMPVIAHADSQSLVLVWADELGTARHARAEARDPATGAVRWTTDLRFAIDRIEPGPDPAARLNGRIVSPLEGSVGNSHLLASSDGRTLVVTDRMGRAVGVDLAGGAVLWSRRLGMTRVYGMDLNAGVLGACGAAVRSVNAGPDDSPDEAALRGVAEAVDARTGEPIQIIEDLGAETRWVRVAPDGQVLVGAGTRVIAMDTVGGRIDWTNADEQMLASQGAWVVGETLIVLGPDGLLWPVPRREGVVPGTALDFSGLVVDAGVVSVHSRAFGTVVLSDDGVATVGPGGVTLAADTLGPTRGLGVSAVGERRAVLVERTETDPRGLSVVRLAVVDAMTGRIEDRITVRLPDGVRRSPDMVAIADGVIVLGFGEVSLVLAAPAADG